jgi:hypothetical protein
MVVQVAERTASDKESKRVKREQTPRSKSLQKSEEQSDTNVANKEGRESPHRRATAHAATPVVRVILVIDGQSAPAAAPGQPAEPPPAKPSSGDGAA